MFKSSRVLSAGWRFDRSVNPRKSQIISAASRVSTSPRWTWPARIRCSAAEPRYVASNVVLARRRDRKSTRLNSSHQIISYAVFCLKKKNVEKDVDTVD